VIERSSYACELARRFNRADEGLVAPSGASRAYACIDAPLGHGLTETFEVEPSPCPSRGASASVTGQPPLASRHAFEARLLAQMLDVDCGKRLYIRRLAALAREPERMHAPLDRLEAAAVQELEVACARSAAATEVQRGD